MRLLAVYALISGFMLYAWRNWFVSLCVLILFSAVAEHEDMPRSLLEIRGLSPWNGLCAMVFLAWIVDKLRTNRPLGVPKQLKVLMPIYLIIMVVAVARGLLDLSSYVRWGPATTAGEYVTENIINSLKYLFPAVILFDACRTRKRVHVATACVLAVGCIGAFMVIKRIPISMLMGAGDEWKVRRRVNAVTGLHPNDLALILVLSMWSILGFLRLLKARWKVVALGACGLCGTALALCYSRAGFFACIAVGMVLGAVGSKRLLLLILFGIIPVGLYVPGIQGRLMQGFGDPEFSEEEDAETVTAGRMEFIWPICTEGVGRAPLLGHGRHAASRVLVQEFHEGYGRIPGHCHNAYLDMLLDAGIVGLVSVLGILAYLFYASIKLLRSRGDPLAKAVGNMGLASLVAYSVMALSGQRFFPTENLFVVFCIQGIALRVYVAKFLLKSPIGVLQPPGSRRTVARRDAFQGAAS